MISTDTIAAAIGLLDGPLVDVAALDDAGVIALQSALGALSRLAARHASVTAGELSRRSSRELGYAGLAQASGHRTPEEFLQAVTGVTAVEATRLVRVGSLPPSSPLAIAVAAGEASVVAADAIRRGLGNADDGTSTQTLDTAARELLAVAGSVTPEALYRAAADARSHIDLEGVATRERERRDQRYLRVRQREDGMVSGSFLPDQEDGQLLISAIDTVLSPRRGGPRFVCESERLAADELIADPRTNDQLAADVFVDIIRLAIDVDPGTVFGDRSARRSGHRHGSRTRFGHRLSAISHPVSDSHLQREMEDAGFPAVRVNRVTVKHTMCDIGIATEDRPTCRTACSCVDTITCSFTTTAVR